MYNFKNVGFFFFCMYPRYFISLKKIWFWRLILHLALNEENRTLRGKGKAGNRECGGWELKECLRSCQKFKFLRKVREKRSFLYYHLFFCFEKLDSLMCFLVQIKLFILVDITLSYLLEASIESYLQVKLLTQADTIKDDVGGYWRRNNP